MIPLHRMKGSIVLLSKSMTSQFPFDRVMKWNGLGNCLTPTDMDEWLPQNISVNHQQIRLIIIGLLILNSDFTSIKINVLLLLLIPLVTLSVVVPIWPFCLIGVP